MENIKMGSHDKEIIVTEPVEDKTTIKQIQELIQKNEKTITELQDRNVILSGYIVEAKKKGIQE